jgi:hypothetical protein
LIQLPPTRQVLRQLHARHAHHTRDITCCSHRCQDQVGSRQRAISSNTHKTGEILPQPFLSHTDSAYTAQDKTSEACELAKPLTAFNTPSWTARKQRQLLTQSSLHLDSPTTKPQNRFRLASKGNRNLCQQTRYHETFIANAPSKALLRSFAQHTQLCSCQVSSKPFIQIFHATRQATAT